MNAREASGGPEVGVITCSKHHQNSNAEEHPSRLLITRCCILSLMVQHCGCGNWKGMREMLCKIMDEQETCDNDNVGAI
jgi:hypothetical protein